MLIELDFATVLSQWPLLFSGLLWTLGLTIVGTTLGLLLGIACAWVRTGGPAWLRFVAGTYVEAIRNTPFIVQLFFIFFGLPAIGVRISPEVASLLAMVINLGAYSTEIVRAGIEATPKGLVEAGVSLALNRRQLFVRVVLPPALKKVWPAVVSQAIIVMLGSSVCSQVSMPELSYAANLIQSRTFRAFEAFIVATSLYLLLSISLRRALSWIGPRFLFGR